MNGGGVQMKVNLSESEVKIQAKVNARSEK